MRALALGIVRMDLIKRVSRGGHGVGRALLMPPSQLTFSFPKSSANNNDLENITTYHKYIMN